MGFGVNLLELAEKIGITGFLHCDELDKLVELAANKDVLEVGSYRGLSAWGMAISAKTLTCVDTFQSASDGQRQTGQFTTLDVFMEAIGRFKNVRVCVGKSHEVKVLGDFDMVFLDCMHDFGSVRADIHRWWAKLRPGGLFVMHDYRHRDWPGVEKAADELFGPASEGTTLVTLRWVQKNE